MTHTLGSCDMQSRNVLPITWHVYVYVSIIPKFMITICKIFVVNIRAKIFSSTSSACHIYAVYK